jgi:hypothetical protein
VKIAFDATPAARAYTSAFRRLWEMPGFDPRAALIAEAGVILKTWAGRTKVGDPARAIIRARSRAAKASGVSKHGSVLYGVTVNTGRTGGIPGNVWLRTRRGKYSMAGVVSDSGGVRFSWLHHGKEEWEELQERTQLYARNLVGELKYATKSVGLARQSVIQIADDLGIDIAQVKGGGTLSAAGIAKARAAIASNGRAYRNGTGLSGGDKGKSFVELINRLPYNQKLGMDRTLAGVLAGRAKFIQTSYEKGALASFSTAQRAFPEIFRVSSSSLS